MYEAKRSAQFQQQIMMEMRLKSRLNMTRTEGNILMTQIRAQKKVYAGKQNQLCSYRERNEGKKVFRDILNRPSLEPSQDSESICKVRFGKRMGISKSPKALESNRSGKKQYEQQSNLESTSPQFRQMHKKEYFPAKQMGKRRLDYSPNHQNRSSNIFCH